ncbi:MAG: hypothetical protein ACRDF4_09310 [Rhabdochlamydiaceae bacterium]
MSINPALGSRSNESQVQGFVPNHSENQVKLIVDGYENLSPEEKENFVKMAYETTKTKNKAIDILLKTFHEINENLEERNRKFEKIQEEFNKLQTDPLTQADIEASGLRVKKAEEELEKATLEHQKAKQETEKVKKQLKQTKQETKEFIKKAEENRSYVIIGWNELKKIGGRFKEKVFKGWNAQVSKKDASSPPLQLEGSRYTYLSLSTKKILAGGALIGGVFFLRGSSEVVYWVTTSGITMVPLQIATEYLGQMS